MAKEKYPYRAWRKLAEADNALTAADLTALSEMTASSAEVNVLDGVNTTLTAAEINVLDGATAGTAVASKALVTNSDNALSALRRVVAAAPDGAVLTAAHSRNVYTNEGAAAPASWDLPAATVGLEYYFYVMAAFGLQINPDGTETIALPSSGAQQGAGKYIVADAVGEYAHVICVKDGQWEVLDYRGTWTAEAP